MMKKISFVFALIALLLGACQSSDDTQKEEDKTAKEEQTEEDASWNVPDTDNRPLEVRFREVRQGLDSAWQAIREADSIKIAQVDFLEEELPQEPSFASYDELEALVEQAAWFGQNPITKETIQETAKIDQYDQHLDQFRQLTDSLMATSDELPPEATKRLKTIIELDQADIIRRNTYESYVQKYNEIRQNESDSLQIIGFENLEPAPKFNYGTRVQ